MEALYRGVRTVLIEVGKVGTTLIIALFPPVRIHVLLIMVHLENTAGKLEPSLPTMVTAKKIAICGFDSVRRN